MSGTFGMKLASQTRPLYSVPLPLKKSSSPLNRFEKTKSLLKMKSSSLNRRIVGGAVVTER